MRTLSMVRTLVGGTPLAGRWVSIGYTLTDLFFVVLSAVAVFYFRFVPDWLPRLVRGELPAIPEYPFQDEYLAFLFLYGVMVVLFCQSQGLYRTLPTRTALGESLDVAKAVVLATLLLTVFIYLSGVKTVSRLVVVSAGLLNVVMLAAWRLWWRQVVERRVAEGYGVRNVLIVGAGRVGQKLAHYLEKNKHLGFVVKGFLDSNHAADPRVLGRIEDFRQVARAHFADEVFITIPSEREVVKKIALEARSQGLDVKLVPDMYDGLGWRVSLERMGDFPVMALHTEPIPMVGLLVKRALDMVFSSAALIFLSPLMAAIALVIKLDSSGPVLYRGERVGKKGRKFKCYKFRTMVANAAELKDQLRQLNERQGPFFKLADDPRVTRVGKFLRKYSLDELPQFWNVLKGDMSLVGPRPHPVDDYEQYSLEDLRRLDVTPGITGLWQIYARHNPSFAENMAFDLEYVENWNLWLDLKILLRTLPVTIRGTGT